MVHPLKTYLSSLDESVLDFGARVGASRQTLYRIINRQQTPKPALARRIVEATGGAVTLNDLFADSSATIVSLNETRDEPELDHRRLKLAIFIVVNHLIPVGVREPAETAVEIAAEAVANTFAALKPVTSRQGPARLTQALRPVLEEILLECSGPMPGGALDRGAKLATDLYYQSSQFEA